MGQTVVMVLLSVMAGVVVVGVLRRLWTDGPDGGNSATFRDWIEYEFERARRYGHPVSLIRISRLDHALWGSTAVPVCKGGLRATDHLFAHRRGEILVLAPEVDRTGAATLASRMRDELGDPSVDLRTASFPDDALTSHAIMELLESAGEDHRQPRLRVPALRRAS